MNEDFWLKQFLTMKNNYWTVVKCTEYLQKRNEMMKSFILDLCTRDDSVGNNARQLLNKIKDINIEVK